jgi:hypothetical protein
MTQNGDGDDLSPSHKNLIAAVGLGAVADPKLL